MKRAILLVFVLILILTAKSNAQIENPVKWRYVTKKISAGLMEVHLLATIDAGWHIYAQQQSQDAIAIPTKITFAKIPGLTLIGKPTEVGKKEKCVVEGLDITNLQYANKVDFVQRVKVTPEVNAIKGTITFQACTSERCLAEKTIDFSVPMR